MYMDMGQRPQHMIFQKSWRNTHFSFVCWVIFDYILYTISVLNHQGYLEMALILDNYYLILAELSAAVMYLT